MKTKWPEADFECVFRDVSGGNAKTLQTDFKPAGAFPIVDQGKELVAGFTDDAGRLCKAELPVIVFGDHTRVFKYIDFPFCMGADGTKVLRPQIEADVKFLFYYLRSLEIPSEGYSRHFKFLKRTSIPLPPIDEQRRIADILDKAEALRAKRRETIARLDTLAQSIFIEMFGDPVTNPRGWCVKSLQDVVKAGTIVTYGIVQAGEEFPSGVPYIRTGDIVHGHIVLQTLRRTDPAIAARFNQSRVEAGDIVMSIRATVELVPWCPERSMGRT